MKTIKIMLAILAFSFLAAGSYAQDTPRADVAFGYSYLHINSNSTAGLPSINSNGFSGSLGVNVAGPLGVAADFGVYHGSTSGIGITNESYLFGPRFSVHHIDKFVPFVQALFGGVHTSIANGGGSTSDFAYSFGGGTDIAIAKDGMIALRPQFDYLGVRDSGVTLSTERVSASIVINFGKK